MTMTIYHTSMTFVTVHFKVFLVSYFVSISACCLEYFHYTRCVLPLYYVLARLVLAKYYRFLTFFLLG